MSQYSILKIPVNREKSVFYYYKPYQPKDQEDIQDSLKSRAEIPSSRSLYVCHFLRPIEETFIQKFFGQVGKISAIHIGTYKNKACNKRKRRTIYYAIIVFKKASDMRKVVEDQKFL